MDDVHLKSVAELRTDLDAGCYSATELCEWTLTRIHGLDPTLNSFVTVTPELALEQARAADRAISAGHAGPLTGIPIAHKDIFCTKGVRTACGSRMLDSFISPYDATVVCRLAQAGTVMLGKTNMDEFAMGSSTETSYYGPVRNPWNLDCVPGGSSGGSSAAVAARLAPLATGTDTGGSIRQPAALTGISGIKPTYGRVSRFGIVAFASSLDQAGLLGRSAEDLAWGLAAISGLDDRDSTSVDRPVDDFAKTLDQPLNGIRIGLPREHFGPSLDSDVGAVVQQAAEELEKLGATLRDVELPNTKLSIPAYYVVAPAECSSNLSRFDGVRYGYRTEHAADLEDLFKRSRSEGFGNEVKRRIMVGTYVLSAGYYDAFYLKAQKLRRLIKEDFVRAFEEVDVLLGPTSPFSAFPIGEKVDDPVTMYACDINTTGVNLAGLPGMSIPGGFVNDLPVGLQLIGNYFEESKLLNVAHQYQQGTDWHQCCPARFD